MASIVGATSQHSTFRLDQVIDLILLLIFHGLICHFDECFSGFELLRDL
jgi:hypothetical protein